MGEEGTKSFNKDEKPTTHLVSSCFDEQMHNFDWHQRYVELEEGLENRTCNEDEVKRLRAENTALMEKCDVLLETLTSRFGTPEGGQPLLRHAKSSATLR